MVVFFSRLFTWGASQFWSQTTRGNELDRDAEMKGTSLLWVSLDTWTLLVNLSSCASGRWRWWKSYLVWLVLVTTGFGSSISLDLGLVLFFPHFYRHNRCGSWPKNTSHTSDILLLFKSRNDERFGLIPGGFTTLSQNMSLMAFSGHVTRRYYLKTHPNAFEDACSVFFFSFIPPSSLWLRSSRGMGTRDVLWSRGWPSMT